MGHIKESQKRCILQWFLKLRVLAEKGDTPSVQFRDKVLCKVVGDYFAPVIPNDDKDLVAMILNDLHSSALGGHLGRKKLL